MTSLMRELREIVADYGTHRDLLWQFVLRDLRVRYKQAVMGFLWVLIVPALLVGAGLVVRVAMQGGALDALEPATIGSISLRSVLWAAFSTAMSTGTGSLVGNPTLVGKIRFPREVLPLATVLATSVDLSLGLLVLGLMLPLLGGTLSPALLWLPVLLAILAAGTVGLVLALSAANLFFRDVRYLVQASLSVGVLVTPVFYSLGELGAGAAAWLALNPLTPILEGAALVVLEAHDLAQPVIRNGSMLWDPMWLARSAALAVAGLAVASLLFHRAEDLFAERV